MGESVDTSEQSADYCLYKFRAINKHLIDSLVMSRLWCAKPVTLNDPFDCQINLYEAMKRICEGTKSGWQPLLDNPQGFFETMDEKLKGVGICSFSLDFEKSMSASVQWSHYADEYRGVRLLYRIPRAFKDDPKNKIYDVKEVTYKDNVLTNWLLKTRTGGPDFLNGLAATYFSAKSPAWEYEREVRIIRHEPGYLEIPSSYLEQVCFGLLTPEADIDLIKKLAREHCGCNKFCKVIRDESSDFGIATVAI